MADPRRMSRHYGRDGLGRFGLEVHRTLRERIGAWSARPSLRPLLDTLCAQTTLKGFLDYWAEARVADLLLSRGCRLEWEVPTPLGRTCDFHVVRGDEQFYLHVKRLANEETSARRLGISSRLRFLERIKRPFIVRVRWEEHLSEDRMQEFVERAARFIKISHVGDELTVRGELGQELGGVRIVAPWEGPHVSLAIGLPDGFIDEVPRMRRLLKRAHRQFMPRATNVILLASAGVNDASDVETALLGAHEERWDTHPPKGRRVAYGRAEDGFWSPRRRPMSRAGAWCRVGLENLDLPTRLFLREGTHLPGSLESLLRELFEAERTPKSNATDTGPGDIVPGS
ncbi:MAG: hypothetical protein CMJ24_07940 [Phycisphaerae bacterium]|mgnify:CR=1 FL=1|nr:hypothetical protein [Phycisphaerae bacterium]MAB83351.1 hypothetical protein [Phycisphaerae bacterium]MDG1899537.1 hypothetical protein [Phycisphaerales bacterium]